MLAVGDMQRDWDNAEDGVNADGSELDGVEFVRVSSLFAAWAGTDCEMRVRARKGRDVMDTCYWAGYDEGGKHVFDEHEAGENLI